MVSLVSMLSVLWDILSAIKVVLCAQKLYLVEKLLSHKEKLNLSKQHPICRMFI